MRVCDVMITGKQSEYMTSAAAALINVLKFLAHIDDAVHILSPEVLETLQSLK